jgi:hypothetical protein
MMEPLIRISDVVARWEERIADIVSILGNRSLSPASRAYWEGMLRALEVAQAEVKEVLERASQFSRGTS